MMKLEPDFSILSMNTKKKVIVLQDLDAGGPSLTNGMERVAEILAKDLGLDITGFHVLYRDSDGCWDIATITREPATRLYKAHFHPGGKTRKEGEARLDQILARLKIPAHS